MLTTFSSNVKKDGINITKQEKQEFIAFFKEALRQDEIHLGGGINIFANIKWTQKLNQTIFESEAYCKTKEDELNNAQVNTWFGKEFYYSCSKIDNENWELVRQPNIINGGKKTKWKPLKSCTVNELKEKAKSNGLSGYSKLNKSELIALLQRKK